MSDEKTLEIDGIEPLSREQIELGIRINQALLAVGAIARPDAPHLAVLSGVCGDCAAAGIPRKELHDNIDAIYDIVEKNKTRIDSFMDGCPDLRVVSGSQASSPKPSSK